MATQLFSMNDKMMIERLDRLIKQAQSTKRLIELGLVVDHPGYTEPGMEHYDFRIGDFRIKEGFTIMFAGGPNSSTDPLGEVCEPSNGWEYNHVL